MSKARRRAARRKYRQTKRSIEERNEVMYPHPAEPAEDPRVVVMAARARIMGEEPANDHLMGMLVEPAGRAIRIGARDSDEARKLWGVFSLLDAADETYFRRIMGKARFAKPSELEMMPEPFETRADDRPDYRSADEKDRDAVNRWMRWQGLLGRLAGHERYAITSMMRGTAAKPHDGNRLTTAGQAFVAAMRILRSEYDRG